MLRIAIAQFRPRKAAYRDNLSRIGQLLAELAKGPAAPDLVVLPETALTGYFVEGGVHELAVSADQLCADLAAQHEAAGLPPLDLVTGFYEIWNTRLYNSALVARLGGAEAGVKHVHRKIFLPTYGVFDEERFVEPGRSVQAFDLGQCRAAVLVCEDAWHSLVPTIAALDGAQLIIVLSASPARGIQPTDDPDGRPESTIRWERVAQSIATEHGVFVVVAHLVGFEGGKAFPGGSVVVDPRGTVLARAPIFEDAVTQVALDLDEIPRARADEPLLSDLETHLPHLLESLTAPGALPETTSVARPVRPAMPPRETDPLAIDPELTERWLVEFLKDEVTRRRGFERVVLGLSGGVDSAVVAYLAAKAFGPEQVTAVRMPYRTSSQESLLHADLVVGSLGIKSRTIDITAGVEGIASALGDRPPPARLGNIMARMRMITLFDLSAAGQAIPLGTGNKTERLFGYFTWHADDSPPVNPLGDLFKTQVWALARHLGVPGAIVDKAPTADLVAGQTDEGDFGISYARADLILHWVLSGYSSEAIAGLGFSAAEVATVKRRLDSTHWKRKLPTVAMLSPTAIGEFYLRPVDY